MQNEIDRIAEENRSYREIFIDLVKDTVKKTKQSTKTK